MADKTVLLITGSRSLGADPAAMRWVRATLLRRFADAVERGRLVLVAGDAPGVDTAAELLACGLLDAGCDVRRVIFCLDGFIRFSDGLLNRNWTGISPPASGTPEGRRWPLVRNEAMVKAVTRRGLADLAVMECLALIDPASKTHGTEHTAGMAERGGIPTKRLRWTPPGGERS